MRHRSELTEGWSLREKESGTVYPISHMPLQVHEILFENGAIDETFRWGKTADCGWVNDRSWIYETDFAWEGAGAALLEFGGLDTLCTIRLNGETLQECRDCYLSYRIPVSAYLRKGNNHLELEFHPVKAELERIGEEHRELLARTSIPAKSFLRKTFHDFTTYLGNDADFYKAGVYRPVWLTVLPEGVMLEEIQTDYSLNEALDRAELTIRPILYRAPAAGGTPGEEAAGGLPEDLAVTVQVSLDGQEIWRGEQRPGEALCAELEQIRLWWPRGYGDQPLYEVRAEVKAAGNTVDVRTTTVGFRKIQMQGMLNFCINGRSVKLWGANLTPDEGATLCENPKRIRRLLKLAAEANVNTLRIWGEGVPFTDLLYDYADQNGILLWQEFFCGHTQYPRSREVTDLILEEARQLICSRRHHPSILLWCGGNECYLSRDFAAPKEEYLAAAFFEYELKELCSRLDPDRYYHVSSPFFGAYSNDPMLGDTHSYTNSWYVPGGEYPIFPTENLRVCFPKEASLKRYLRTQELPAPGLQGLGELPWPGAYEQITSAESWKKIPPVENFYDARTPEEMIYRFGMAAGLYIKDSVERYRRGKRAAEAFEPRKCMGHFIWKWNTTFPHLYSSMLDAYLEQKIPYYFLKRAYEPALLSIEVWDHIDVWVVNDTSGELSGEAALGLFDLEKNEFVITEAFPYKVKAGESSLIARLDDWGQMTRDKIVCGKLLDRNGQVLSENHSFLDIERHIAFPDAKLALWQEGEELVLKSDRFARSVVLSGGEQGEEYWWDFSDNYFDLFPGVEKRIAMTGIHREGWVQAKGFYSGKSDKVKIKTVKEDMEG